MQLKTIKKIIEQVCDFYYLDIQESNNHFTIIAVSDDFINLNKLKRHQIVYKPINQLIAENIMHAVTIKAFTKQEWQEDNSMLNQEVDR